MPGAVVFNGHPASKRSPVPKTSTARRARMKTTGRSACGRVSRRSIFQFALCTLAIESMKSFANSATMAIFPASVRFQVSLPTPRRLPPPSFPAPRIATGTPRYEAAMLREVASLPANPHEDLRSNGTSASRFSKSLPARSLYRVIDCACGGAIRSHRMVQFPRV